jgi:Zn-dependent M32 family carboxypeptidase
MSRTRTRTHKTASRLTTMGQASSARESVFGTSATSSHAGYRNAIDSRLHGRRFDTCLSTAIHCNPLQSTASRVEWAQSSAF